MVRDMDPNGSGFYVIIVLVGQLVELVRQIESGSLDQEVLQHIDKKIEEILEYFRDTR